jgi:hypothetical protein
VQQRKQTGKAREKLVQSLGERTTFAVFADKITQGVFENTVLSSCKDSAAAAHADAVALNPERGRVLDVSLVELLRKEYDGNEQGLGQYTRNIMSMARNYLKFDDAQRHLFGPGIPPFNDPKETICATFINIIAPESPEAADFRDRFCNALAGATTDGTPVIARNQTRPQEITILSVTNVFPARFIAVVEYLRNEYSHRLAQPQSKRAFLELHSEGESYDLASDQHFYGLFADTYKPADILPWVMLADALGLIEQGKDFETGRPTVRLTTVNRDGLTEKLVLGPDMDTVVEDADAAAIEELQNQVQQALKGDYIRIEKRQELATTLLQRVRSTGETQTVDSPRYKQEVAAYSVIRKTLELGD